MSSSRVESGPSDGFKIITQVGCLFHERFATDVPEKERRKTLFRKVTRQALRDGLVQDAVSGSMTFFKKV